MTAPVVRPPYAIQRAASDCAWVLSQEHADRLALAERVAVEVVARMAPERKAHRPSTGEPWLC